MAVLPQKCGHCKGLFLPKSLGAAKVFCIKCAVKCEEASEHIRVYLKRHPEAKQSEIADTLRIPRDFVNYLFDQGRFVPSLSDRPAGSRRPCIVCSRVLSPSEDVYCTTCQKMIDARLHVRLTGKSTLPPTPQREGDPSRSTALPPRLKPPGIPSPENLFPPR